MYVLSYVLVGAIAGLLSGWLVARDRGYALLADVEAGVIGGFSGWLCGEAGGGGAGILVGSFIAMLMSGTILRRKRGDVAPAPATSA